jgi:rare lipoprotein A (peptidoglycan hydrolase)
MASFTKPYRDFTRPWRARPRLATVAVSTLLAIITAQSAAMAEPLPKGGGYFKLGPSYEIMGHRYTPQDTDDLDVTGLASWYGVEVHGRKTANGELFDMNALTAAHKTLPLPSYVYVTNLENGRKLLVRVNDRGPFVGDRMIDVSDRVAKHLGFADRGLTDVRVEYAGPAPLDGDDRRERQVLAENLVDRIDLGVHSKRIAKAPLPPVQPTTVAMASLETNTASLITMPDRTKAMLERPLQRSLVSPTPPIRAAKIAKPDEKPEATKPVRLARATQPHRTESGTNLGYRPFDPCWSCLARDQ